jgi:hypothetical protein
MCSTPPVENPNTSDAALNKPVFVSSQKAKPGEAAEPFDVLCGTVVDKEPVPMVILATPAVKKEKLSASRDPNPVFVSPVNEYAIGPTGTSIWPEETVNPEVNVFVPPML